MRPRLLNRIRLAAARLVVGRTRTLEEPRMYLTDLADACRKSGLKIVEVDGWRTRGHGPMSSVDTIAVHHTATAKSASGDYPSLGIVRDGRPGLPGPLSQLGLGRSGTVYVIAAGVSYHAGETFRSSQDNWHAIGIEAEHDGVSPWPAALVDAYAALCAALIDHYDLPVSAIQGHKEIAKPLGRKTDPNFDMDAFRAQVADQGDDMKPEDFDRIRAIVREEVGGVLDEDMNVRDPKGDKDFRGVSLRAAIKAIARATGVTKK